MKKLLIPLVCGLFAICSCNLEGSYSATNVQDIVTIVEHQPMNDLGVQYTITKKAQDTPELTEGNRYFMLFDILNRQYEISVKSASPVEILPAQAVDPAEEIKGHDPIQIYFNWIGSRYMDLAIGYYFDEKSNYARTFQARYSLDEASTLNVFLYLDGNNENPASMDENNLKQNTHFISIPISDWDFKAVTLTVDILTSTSEGYVIEQKTYPTRQ